MTAEHKRSSKHDRSGTILHNGDRMKQSEFHRDYEAMPDDYRVELIGGMVFEPSPVGYSHARSDSRLTCLLEHYAALTTGLESAHNATVILGEEDEVQPDALLRVMPAYGGRSRNTRKKNAEEKECVYVAGAPEMVAEVAYSSRAIDLHLKNDRYALAGVLEYLVLCLAPLEIRWFDLPHNKSLKADADGIFRSRVFPGLWIDGAALLELDYARSMKALNMGMQTADYREFATRVSKQK